MIKTELVTTLKRHATEILDDLRADHDPVLITQHGRPAAYRTRDAGAAWAIADAPAESIARTMVSGEL